MKKLIIVILFVTNLTWSQNNKFFGVIKNTETLQPIEFVNIYFKNSLANSTGAISNELGEFVINSNNLEVVFSHINYETLTLNLSKNSNEILLKPKNYVLDEIVISNISAKDYLIDIIKSSKSKIDKNTLLKSYCREIVKINDDFTKFSDALVNYYVKKGNGKSKITLGQHRALKNNEINHEDFRNIDNINSVFKLKDYVKDAYNFDELKNLLKNKEYKIIRKIKKESNGEEYEYIEIIPNADSDKMLNEGYVIIDNKTKSILEYKIYTSENHLKNSKLINLLIAKAKLNNVLFWSKFKIINNQYILIYNKKKVEMYIKMGKNINHDFSFTSDLFVYEFKNNIKIPSKGYEKRTIYQAGNEYDESFWENFNAFPLNKNEIEFINSVQPK